MEQLKKTGLAMKGVKAIPRDLAFPLSKTESWHDIYDFIKYVSYIFFLISNESFIISV